MVTDKPIIRAFLLWVLGGKNDTLYQLHKTNKQTNKHTETLGSKEEEKKRSTKNYFMNWACRTPQ